MSYGQREPDILICHRLPSSYPTEINLTPLAVIVTIVINDGQYSQIELEEVTTPMERFPQAVDD